MEVTKKYIFSSARLGFRNWEDLDLRPFSEMNNDPHVMTYFPSIQSPERSLAFVTRMKSQYVKKGYTYFAVDTLNDADFIGFIGLSEQTFSSPFTPCIDIGWRLKPSAWGKGYATEGARCCLDFARDILNLREVFAFSPAVNLPSIRVMLQAGMEKAGEFDHPDLSDNARLRRCVAFRKVNRIVK